MFWRAPISTFCAYSALAPTNAMVCGRGFICDAVRMKPFDGAGLLSVPCGRIWKYLL
jgi:hypothetical protein